MYQTLANTQYHHVGAIRPVDEDPQILKGQGLSLTRPGASRPIHNQGRPLLAHACDAKTAIAERVNRRQACA